MPFAAGLELGARQLSSAEAAALRPFAALLDLVPCNDSPALLAADGRRPLTYRRLRAAAARFPAGGLRLGRGSRLAAVLPNGPELAALFLAASCHCAFAPLNPALTDSELEHELEHFGCTHLVVLAGRAQGRYSAVASKLQLSVFRLLADPAEAGLFTLAALAAATVGGGPGRVVTGSAGAPQEVWEEIKADDEKHQQASWAHPPPSSTSAAVPAATTAAGTCTSTYQDGQVGPLEVALLLHTSGTSAKPKTVPLTHRHLGSGAVALMSTLQRTKDDVCINVMPLFHIHGQIVNLLGTLVAGASVICTPGFNDPAEFFSWVAEHQPTWYSAVPTMHFAFVEHGKRLHGMFPKHRLNLIRNCSAALLPAVADAMAELWGATIVPTYGMTEVLPICSQPAGLDDSRKRGSVGPAAGPEVGIMRVDEDSDGVPTGWVMVERALDGVAGHQDGEVVVRGVCQMAGYEGDDLANAKTWLGRSGWMRTGDKGWMDADGYVSLSGRFKEIINRSGEKISPFEVEQVLIGHSSVGNLIAFAADHALHGEAVGVAVVVQQGCSAPTVRELREFGMSRLAAAKLPEVVVVVAEVPRGPTGKPARIGFAKAHGVAVVGSGARPLEASVSAPVSMSGGAETTGGMPPQTEVERTLASIWADVLGLPRAAVGRGDSFVVLGGDSLTAHTLASKVRAAVPAAALLRPEALLALPTVAAMAAVLDPASTAKQTPAQQAADSRPVKKIDPVLLLARAGDVAGLRRLGAPAVCAVRDRQGCTALHWAAADGQIGACRWLAAAGIPTGGGGSRERRTPLHLAARHGRFEVCRWLVEECGEQPDARAKHGVSPFQLAVWQGHIAICRWLVGQHDVDPRQVNDFDCGAGHWVALCPSRPESLDLPHWLLHDCGLDFAVRNNQGHSALHKAGWAGRRVLCAWLRDHAGLRDGAVDNAGNYAADMADMAGHLSTARFLRRHCSAARAAALALLQLPKTLLDAASDDDDDEGDLEMERKRPRVDIETAESGGTAAVAAIRQAYRQAALRSHPDKCSGEGEAGWTEVQAAYNLLTNEAATAEPGQMNTRHRYRLVLTAMAEETTVGTSERDVQEGGEDDQTRVAAGGEAEPGSDAALARLKAEIVALVLEHPGGMPLSNLPKRYRQVWRRDLPPPRQFRCKKLVQLLRRRMADSVVVEQESTNHTVLRPTLRLLASLGSAARAER